MPRPHRLKPIPISKEAVLHAFCSPPIAEKGCPPTLIVTPPEPTSASDFEIHFFSRPSGDSSASEGSTYYSRVKFGLRSLFTTLPFQQSAKAVPEEIRQTLLEEKEALSIETTVTSTTTAVTTNTPATWSPIPPAAYEYSALPSSEEEGLIRLPEDDPEGELEEREEILASMQQRKLTSAARTRRMRIVLLVGLPLAVVGFHVLSHQLGFGMLPFEEDSVHG